MLLDHATWRLGPGDRVGVVGLNGSGKTTLLRLLAGTLPVGSDGSQDRAGPGGAKQPAADGPQHQDLVASGRVVRGKTVRLGYLTQEPGPVDPGLRALEAAQQVRGSVRLGNRDMSASQLLDLLGLRGDRQWTLVGELSGGERRRLQLLMLLMAEPNVLLLDEPTNDLDIETLTELEDLLDGWPGSLVVVSHDRYFLERVTDHVVGLIGGKLAYLPGRLGVPGQATGARAGGGQPAPRRRTGGRRVCGGPAARWPEGADQAGAAARPDLGSGGGADGGAGRACQRLSAADRARRRAPGRAGGTGGLEERWLTVAEELAE